MRTSAPRLLRYVTAPVEGGGDGQQLSESASEGAAEETVNDETTDEDAGEGEDEEDAPEVFDHDRALRKIRKANAEARAQRERAKAAEAKASTADDLARENADLKRQVLQMQTAAEFGLKPSLAARLQGSTAEEMRQDAQELLEMFSPAGPPSPRPKASPSAPRARKDEDREESIEAIGARMFRH